MNICTVFDVILSFKRLRWGFKKFKCLIEQDSSNVTPENTQNSFEIIENKDESQECFYLPLIPFSAMINAIFVSSIFVTFPNWFFTFLVITKFLRTVFVIYFCFSWCWTYWTRHLFSKTWTSALYTFRKRVDWFIVMKCWFWGINRDPRLVICEKYIRHQLKKTW